MKIMLVQMITIHLSDPGDVE